jgi:hypothetical protein
MGTQTFIPRDYDVFAGLDVDKKSISVTFTDHQGLLKSLTMPYNVEYLVNCVFRTKPATQSGANRPPFRGKPATVVVWG